jgi:aryl-alcohol dehydrogenase-like predicted oxidoreductase
VDTVQPPLSLIAPHALDDVIPWAERHQTGVLAYSPMSSGLLSGAFSRDRVESLADDDWRKTNPDFIEPRLSENLRIVEALDVVARRHSSSVAEVAIAWVLHCPGVTAAIVGGRRPDQVDGWINSAALRLDKADLDEIAAARRGGAAMERTAAPSR